MPNAKKRPEAVDLIKTRFREHWNVASDVAAQSALMAEAESRLSFLKMMTPRNQQRGVSQGGTTRIIYHGGEKLDVDEAEGLGEVVRNPSHVSFSDYISLQSVRRLFF
jgi:hypothetical protein